MRLCGSAVPMIHPTNAGGLGFFDLHQCGFDNKNLERAGLDHSLLPKMVSDGEILGEFSDCTPEGNFGSAGPRRSIPVCVSIGDNQASFLGSVQDSLGSVSVNIGTGSQISLVSSGFENSGALEARPFFEDQFLLVGASLCGGRAYAILEKFFRQVIKMAGFPGDASLYDAMDAMAGTAASAGAESTDEPSLTVNTLFAGSRSDPSVRGSIQNISENNFTPARLITGFLNGAVQELYDFYQPLRKENNEAHVIVGAGNGIRKSEPLKRILSEKFNMPLEIPLYEEEAAYGAALYALTCTGYFKTLSQAQSLVKYKGTIDFRKSRQS